MTHSTTSPRGFILRARFNKPELEQSDLMAKTSATSKASRKNQTTIPARVRKALRVAKGDTLLWTIDGEEVSIRIISQAKVDWTKKDLELLEWTSEPEPEASV